MIIKSLRHKQRNANYSVNYVFDGIPEDKNEQWIIFQNMTDGFSREEIINQFNENAQYLTKTLKRKKTFRYHEILAFAHDNAKDLNREKLQRITNKYLSLRDPNGLSQAICVPHLDKHFHVHILLTSNFIESSRSGDMMMNNQQYYELRREMERWILRELPELHLSTVYLSQEEIQKTLPSKYRAERRLLELNKSSQKSAKSRLAEKISSLLSKSNTLEEFEQIINREPEFKTYYRRGKLTGIIHQNKKKYRFKNLGINLLRENFQVLKRMNELQQIKSRNQERDNSQELER